MPWETGVEAEVRVGIRSDVKAVTLTLSSGNFRFDWVKTVDAKGVERAAFGEDEMVAIHSKVTNHGDVKDRPTMRITDSDTGEVLFEHDFVTEVEPGSSIDPWTDAGKMPNHDWHLLVEITP